MHRKMVVDSPVVVGGNLRYQNSHHRVLSYKFTRSSFSWYLELGANAKMWTVLAGL